MAVATADARVAIDVTCEAEFWDVNSRRRSTLSNGGGLTRPTM
jgi:hypothetical protein